MKTSETKTIDGSEWTVTQFPATVGLKLGSRLLKLVGGPLGEAFGGIDTGAGSIMEARVDYGAIGKAMGGLFERLEEDAVVTLIKGLLAETRCNGTEVGIQFDILFQGRYMTLLKVVAFAVEVNYKIPLTELLGSLGNQQTSEKT